MSAYVFHLILPQHYEISRSPPFIDKEISVEEGEKT